jgi:hypothetical protein
MKFIILINLYHYVETGGNSNGIPLSTWIMDTPQFDEANINRMEFMTPVSDSSGTRGVNSVVQVYQL